MKQEVSYFKKCLKCDEVVEYVMRSHNTNISLKEKDIFSIIANDVQHPYSHEWCEKCNHHTMQMVVGWDYLEA